MPPRSENDIGTWEKKKKKNPRVHHTLHIIFLLFYTLLFALSWHPYRSQTNQKHWWEVETPHELLAPDTTEPPSFSTPSSSTIRFRMASSPLTRSTSSSTASSWSVPSTQDLLDSDDDENPFSRRTKKVFTLFIFSSNMNESKISTIASSVFKL